MVDIAKSNRVFRAKNEIRKDEIDRGMRTVSTQIVPIAAEHIEGFHRALDSVARERRYLEFLEAPPLEQTCEFVLHNIANDYPQFVAVIENRVIGWCDILPKGRPIFTHSGVLGMGIVPEYRGKGVGTSLIEATLEKAWGQNLVCIELTVFSDSPPAIEKFMKKPAFVAKANCGTTRSSTAATRTR